MNNSDSVWSPVVDSETDEFPRRARVISETCGIDTETWQELAWQAMAGALAPIDSQELDGEALLAAWRKDRDEQR